MKKLFKAILVILGASLLEVGIISCSFYLQTYSVGESYVITIQSEEVTVRIERKIYEFFPVDNCYYIVKTSDCESCYVYSHKELSEQIDKHAKNLAARIATKAEQEKRKKILLDGCKSLF